LDKIPPEGISFFNCKTDVLQNGTSNIQNIVLKKIFTVTTNEKLNQTISSFYHDIYSSLCFSMNLFSPCFLGGMDSFITFKGDNLIEIGICGMSIVSKSEEEEEENKLKSFNIPQLLPNNLPTPSPRVKKTPSDFLFEMEGIDFKNDSGTVLENKLTEDEYDYVRSLIL
jgi:hypothetical protein